MALRTAFDAAINAARGLGLAIALAASAACGGPAPSGAPAPLARTSPPSASSAALTAAACGGTGPHDRHTAMVECAACHPCGGTTGFGAQIVLPGGRTVAGGTYDAAASTCSVGCHNPSGSPSAQPVSWTASGPIACTSCHVQAPAGAGTRHVSASGDPAADREICQGCHVMTAHLGGVARVLGADGAPVDVTTGNALQANPLCLGCHDGAGRSLGGNAPPLLEGWTATATGDFHGARAGVGYGGTLLAPYQRGQAAIACIACHDSHSSANPYLFADVVNGRAVPGGAITTAGVGAAALCSSCHAGNRHAGCATCHGVDPVPANGACFWCHGHEGIVNFPRPEYGTVSNHWAKAGNPPGCATHCHDSVAWEGPGWLQPVEYVPPAIPAAGVRVTGITGTSATVEWTTSEPATSFVEYGAGALDHVAGGGAPSTNHWVTVSGLQAGTTYTFRARSADPFRNVTRSTSATFTTRLPDAPPAPFLVPEPAVWGEQETYAATTLQWEPVSDPNGDAVEYRVVVDDSPSFTSPLIEDSGWTAATQFEAIVPTYFEFGVVYYWRVVARDATGLESPWSSTESFAAYDYAYGW